MKRLKDLLPNFDHNELLLLKKDIDSGSFELKKMILNQIKENEKSHEKACSTCSNNMHSESVENFTLIMGPDSFKKKASFCGIDCLEFFLNKVKKIRSNDYTSEINNESDSASNH